MRYKILNIVKRYSLLCFVFIFLLVPFVGLTAFASAPSFYVTPIENTLSGTTINNPGNCVGNVDYEGGFSTSVVIFEVGTYVFDGFLSDVIMTGGALCSPFYVMYSSGFEAYEDASTRLELVVTEDMFVDVGTENNPQFAFSCVVNSLDSPVTVTKVQTAQSQGLYYSAFDLLADYMYGEVELTAEQNMVLTILATCCVLFVVIVPFLLVLWIIRLFTGG